MNQFLAKSILLATEYIRGEHIARYLSELEKTQWHSNEELKCFQWNKLKQLLEHAYKEVPWYNRSFNKVGIVPNDITGPEDLNLLPILTKDDIRHNGFSFLAKNFTGKITRIKSSGSTGISLKFGRDRVSIGYGRAAMYRGHRWHRVDLGEKEAKLWGVPISSKSRLIYKAGDILLNRFRERSFDMTDNVMTEFFEKIVDKRPQYLMAYPSLAYQFALFIKNKGLRVPSMLKMVKVTSETLFDYQKELLEEVFGCAVVNEYGCAEVGLIGFTCPAGGMHLMSECVYVEEDKEDFLHDGNKDLIITDLNNYAHPIIRYRLGDRGKLSDKLCVCGRSLPLIESIQGRISDIVYKDNGTPVHSSIFSYLLKEITQAGWGVTQYKATQDRIGHLCIEIVKGDNYSIEVEKFLYDSINNMLGEGTTLDIHYCESIERTQAGKLRYFQSNIPAD